MAMKPVETVKGIYKDIKGAFGFGDDEEPQSAKAAVEGAKAAIRQGHRLQTKKPGSGKAWEISSRSAPIPNRPRSNRSRGEPLHRADETRPL